MNFIDKTFLCAIVFMLIIIILAISFAEHELPLANDEWTEQQTEYIPRLNQSMNGTERIDLARQICTDVANGFRPGNFDQYINQYRGSSHQAFVQKNVDMALFKRTVSSGSSDSTVSKAQLTTWSNLISSGLKKVPT